MTMFAALRCRLGRHRPDEEVRWNRGYAFTTCLRCGRDLVRPPAGNWQVPIGHRVVWLAPEAPVVRPQPPAAAPIEPPLPEPAARAPEPPAIPLPERTEAESVRPLAPPVPDDAAAGEGSLSEDATSIGDAPFDDRGASADSSRHDAAPDIPAEAAPETPAVPLIGKLVIEIVVVQAAAVTAAEAPIASVMTSVQQIEEPAADGPAVEVETIVAAPVVERPARDIPIAEDPAAEAPPPDAAPPRAVTKPPSAAPIRRPAGQASPFDFSDLDADDDRHPPSSPAARRRRQLG